jgi:thiol-disulfide isomerase/thioredoxin
VTFARGASSTCALLVALVAACNRSPTIAQEAPTTPSAQANANASASASANGKESADASGERGVRVVVAVQDSDALSVVRTERLKAKAEGRVLVVYAGAGWCEPCKRFKHAIQTGALDDKLARTTLLVFDADRDTERLASAGYKFQFIPYVALPAADGHPSDSQEARAKGSESWRELIGKLEAWQAKGP